MGSLWGAYQHSPNLIKVFQMKGWQLKLLRRENWRSVQGAKNNSLCSHNSHHFNSAPFKAKMSCKQGYIGYANMLNLFRKIFWFSFTHRANECNTPLPIIWSYTIKRWIHSALPPWFNKASHLTQLNHWVIHTCIQETKLQHWTQNLESYDFMCTYCCYPPMWHSTACSGLPHDALPANRKTHLYGSLWGIPT